MEDPRPTAGVAQDVLMELLQELRRSLRERGEAPAGEWVEQSADDLRLGRKTGWYYPGGVGGGLAFFAVEGREAYGHVHAADGPEAAERSLRLARAVLDGLPESVRSVDIGFTGLPGNVEHAVLEQLSGRPGSVVIERLAMERALGEADGGPPGPAPQGLRLVPARSVTVEALADLDRRSFTGTVDELLIGPTEEDYRRVVGALLAGSLGRFLDEASAALVTDDPTTLVGALLSGEESARRGIFLDFLVDPKFRGRGYGRLLLRWGSRALWALGYSSVRLWVTAANTPARGLYDSTGFRTVATAAIYRWDRSSAAAQEHTSR